MTSRIMSYRPKNRYGDLNEATAALIDAAGGVRGAADLCRVGKSQLSDYANEHTDPPKYMPIDVVLQLERASGKRIISDHLAALHDCIVVQLPNYPQSPDVSGAVSRFMKRIGQLGKENGEFMAVGAEAVADGILEQDELRDMLRELDDVLSAGAELRQMITARLAAE